jgi:hypothetical protein
MKVLKLPQKMIPAIPPVARIEPRLQRADGLHSQFQSRRRIPLLDLESFVIPPS